MPDRCDSTNTITHSLAIHYTLAATKIAYSKNCKSMLGLSTNKRIKVGLTNTKATHLSKIQR